IAASSPGSLHYEQKSLKLIVPDMKHHRPAEPKKWKIAIVVWLAIYPVITLLQFLFGHQLGKISPLPLRTLVITAIVVPLMVYVAEPLVSRIFASWLKK
ncbi:MAG TPA: hypothetical protein VIS56_01820, partial [Candidatus Saccharimonadales bacterium]